jgi:hypothetical protein
LAGREYWYAGKCPAKWEFLVALAAPRRRSAPDRIASNHYLVYQILTFFSFIYAVLCGKSVALFFQTDYNGV